MRFACGGLFYLCLSCAALGATKPHTTVDLVLPVETARAGDTVLAGIRLRMEPNWHTYWENPGDAGGKTTVEWNLPPGVIAGEIRWPAPERLDTEGLTTFVYHDQVTLLVPLHLDPKLPPGRLPIRATVSWLECEQLCLPGQSNVSGEITVGSEVALSADAELIDSAEAVLPRPGSELGLRSAWEEGGTNGSRNLIFEWPAAPATSHPDFYPRLHDQYEAQLAPELLPVDSSRIAMRIGIKSEGGHLPERIDGLLVQTVDGRRQSYDVALVPSSTDSSPGTPSSAGDSPRQFPSAGILASQLLAALLGGLILNLMPCVLPILSLKVLHVVRQRGVPGGHSRAHGMIYTLGVLASFWVFAGLVIAGKLVSVGAQFQSPVFIVAITTLVTLVSLNLFGVFEVVLPGAAVGRAGELASKEGMAGSFFKGSLAVVLGASCVAPVFAPVMGWAFSQPAPVILATFSMVGLGLALPFLLVSFYPILQSWLPKPGPWMAKFKIAMGFPMMATAAWLLSQTADHFGNRGPLWVGLFLVILALAAWVYGEFGQRSYARRGLAAACALFIAGAGYAWTLEHELNWRTPPDPVGISETGAGKTESKIPWKPWSREALALARAEGRPILVDFTANWCLTCQLNRKTSLEVAAVRDKIKEVNAIVLLADYTRKNPEIASELKRFERAGVPLVLVYPKDAGTPPQILPTLLTPEIVLDALDTAAR